MTPGSVTVHRPNLGDAHVVALALEVVRAGGFVWLAADGLSMMPLLRPGDRLLVAPAGEVRRGQVVLARLGGRLVAHRVVRVDGLGITMRGDACDRDDLRIPAEALVGRVVVAQRGARLICAQATLAFGLPALGRYAMARLQWVRLRLHSHLRKLR
jgi:hypothetical protein